LVLGVASASGQQLGTVEQARAMLDRAISALKSNKATALNEFNDPNNKQFHERDLYVSATTRLMEKLRRMKVLRY
jgi:cytochrome c